MKCSITAEEFATLCDQLIDKLETGELQEVTLYRDSKPVARLEAYSEEPQRLFGAMAGTITVKGDIISPIDVTWDVMKD
jgi:antitoxin (DNA-binding transcriptional repressor) of toxin-antitoxin stability system